MADFVWSTNCNAPCWWCGKTPYGRVWGHAQRPMAVCPSCASALKAALPDAPDWRAVYRNTARSIYNLAHAALYPARDDALTSNAQAILEAAQRLVEAAGHSEGNGHRERGE